MSDDDDGGGYMESRERRTRPVAAEPTGLPEGDMAEHLAVARCPACRHVLVPRVRGGRAGFSCGCGLGI